VGFSRKRLGKDGRPRYTAYYCDIKDRERSAGTFTNKKDADKAWQRAEAKVAEGRLGDPGRGRQTFQDYVEKIWQSATGYTPPVWPDPASFHADAPGLRRR
jgi:hypothetical protein